MYQSNLVPIDGSEISACGLNEATKNREEPGQSPAVISSHQRRKMVRTY
jgi:hypothetical protein